MMKEFLKYGRCRFRDRKCETLNIIFDKKYQVGSSR
jgi:hypothetical protein